jgi:hypothetical protein
MRPILILAASCLGLLAAGARAAGQDEPGKQLVDLWQKKVAATNKDRMLTAADRKLFAAVARGANADFKASDAPLNDPAAAAQWPKERVLQADRIEWLCTDKDARASITERGIAIQGARIEGSLDLRFTRISFPISLESCALQGPIVLEDADLSALYLTGSHTGRIDADRLKVEKSLVMRQGFKALGTVSLVDAKIGKNFECDGGRFLHGRLALNAAGLSVDGYLLMNKSGERSFRADGQVDLSGAKVGKDFDCTGAEFTKPHQKIGDEGMVLNAPGVALNAPGLTVAGTLNMTAGFKAEGEVRLHSARVGINLDCRDATFNSPGQTALGSDGIQVEGYIYLNHSVAQGTVNISNATIGADLSCSDGQFTDAGPFALLANGLKVKGAVYMTGTFKARGEVRLTGASIGQDLICDSADFGNAAGAVALSADGIKVAGSVSLGNQFKAVGEISLVGATVGKHLYCGGSLHNPGGVALRADTARVGANLFLRNVQTTGETSLVNTSVGIDLDCRGARLLNGKAGDRNNKLRALNASGLRVDGNVFLNDGFTARGEVSFAFAVVGGSVDFWGGHFDNPASDPLANTPSYAINAAGINVKLSMLCNDYVEDNAKGCPFTVKGAATFNGAIIGQEFWWVPQEAPASMDVRSAKIGALGFQDAARWSTQDNLWLDGLVYNEIKFAENTPASAQIDWLRLQPDYFPQPYEQLAAALRRAGNDDDAKEVLVKKNEDPRYLAKMRWYERCGHAVFGWSISYGHRPWHAFLWALCFVGVGWALFGWGFWCGLLKPAHDSKEHPPGHHAKSFWFALSRGLVYSFETFTPILNLGLAKNWEPDPERGNWLNWYLWIHIPMGWILTTLWVGAFTGLVKG